MTSVRSWRSMRSAIVSAREMVDVVDAAIMSSAYVSGQMQYTDVGRAAQKQEIRAQARYKIGLAEESAIEVMDAAGTALRRAARSWDRDGGFVFDDRAELYRQEATRLELLHHGNELEDQRHRQADETFADAMATLGLDSSIPIDFEQR